MAFGDFSFPDVIEELGLTEGVANLFPTAEPVPPSAEYVTMYRRAGALAGSGNASEKAKSELLIAPLLVELWARYEDRINLHSGSEVVGDRAAKLSGVCDFVIGRGQQLPRVTAPRIVVIEAKRDLIGNGYGQCIASMVGIQRFNRNAKKDDGPVFGVLTTATVWKFLRLEGTTLTYDHAEFTLDPVDRLFGRLVAMIESLLAVPA